MLLPVHSTTIHQSSSMSHIKPLTIPSKHKHQIPRVKHTEQSTSNPSYINYKPQNSAPTTEYLMTPPTPQPNSSLKVQPSLANSHHASIHQARKLMNRHINSIHSHPSFLDR
ncbi:hypothetical protein ES288_A03G240500v1 [Gossypium darwinii]|uniref:Uncharacterized protein n=1 Tax=Gossypium darwinii TaxID=34276 RepID=A0A5D2H7D8_GOSDA|nr:hypothetical protein ES288_A03G240500v1 [Gossypium darwinii]